MTEGAGMKLWASLRGAEWSTAADVVGAGMVVAGAAAVAWQAGLITAGVAVLAVSWAKGGDR